MMSSEFRIQVICTYQSSSGLYWLTASWAGKKSTKTANKKIAVVTPFRIVKFCLRSRGPNWVAVAPFEPKPGQNESDGLQEAF